MVVALLSYAGESVAGDERVVEALRRGMGYMIGSACERENFEEYASDYLFFFADIERVQEPWVSSRAREVGVGLGEYYLENLFRLDSADEVVDAASALYALECLGMDVDGAFVLLREAAGWYPVQDYLGFDPANGVVPDLDLLIDLLIGFHFTDRMFVDIGVTYAEVLPYVAAVEYRVDPVVEHNRYIDLNNLVTHLVYTVSGYATWNVAAGVMPREVEYIRTWMGYALAWADPETLAEYVDSLRLFGYGPGDPDVAAGVEVLLAIQKADGRWEPLEVEDEYDRYHATWCAMDALRSYDLEGGDGVADLLTGRVLEEWARRYGAGEELRPWMPIGPDLVEGE